MFVPNIDQTKVIITAINAECSRSSRSGVPEAEPDVVEQALEDAAVVEEVARDVGDHDPRDRGRQEEHRAEEAPATHVGVDQEGDRERQRDREGDREDDQPVVLDDADELRIVEEVAVGGEADPLWRAGTRSSW